MAWTRAKSLAVLLAEANAVAPHRSKAWDGTIGDSAHAARASRHNPNAAGVVTALDITHDPAHGMDTYALFDYLREHPHPDLYYVISNRRVARRADGWTVKRYTGSSPHDHHIHVAVGTGPDRQPGPPYDDTDSWGLREWKQGGDDMNAEQDKMLRQLVLSEFARSFDVKILEAKIDGMPSVVEELKRKKDEAVAIRRKELKL